MQLCILVTIVAGLMATHTAHDRQVVFLWPKLGAILLSQALVVLSAWGIAARTVADVQCQHYSEKRIGERLDWGHRIHLSIWVLVSVLILSIFEWPRIVAGFWGPSMLSAKMAAITPIIVPLVVSWGFLYEADRVTTRQTVMLSRWAYVTSHTRLYLLLPLLSILTVLGFSDVFTAVAPQFAASRYAAVVPAIPLAVILVVFPLLIRLLWRAAPMQPGVLRSRLHTRASQLGFQMRDILVWHTDSRSINAAICGFIPRWRYVLVTDKLVDELSPQEVEMVFLHELGHARLGHSLKLMAATTAAIGTGLVLTSSVFHAAGDGNATMGIAKAWMSVATILLSFLLVGRYARLLELEADLWAAARSQFDVETYLRALAKAAGGSDPNRTSWLHPSFARRCEFLLQGLDPAAGWLRYKLRLATVLLVSTVVFVLAYATIC